MSETARYRAVKTYRARIAQRGLRRFEVLGLEADRDLIRSLAKRLAKDDAEAARLCDQVRESVGLGMPGKGGVLAALRRSPLVGADLDLGRERLTGRDIDL